MNEITQQVRDTVLSLIAHENHRRLATLIMDGKTNEELEAFGFRQPQIDEHRVLVQSVIDGETTAPATQEAPAEVQAEQTQPEATQPSEESTPETVTETTEEVPVSTPDTTEVPAETTTEANTEAPAQLPTEEVPATEEETTEPVKDGEIPA